MTQGKNRQGQGNFSTQNETYSMERVFKQHEKELLGILIDENPGFKGKVLDIGCGDGLFMRNLSGYWPDAHYTGLDIDGRLAEIVRQRMEGKDFEMIVGDCMKYDLTEKMDIIIASGILSNFVDFEAVLDRWIGWLDRSGKIYIFGNFNSRAIDTDIRFRNNFTNSGWETGLIAYSVKTVGDYLDSRGVKHEFKRFYLDIDIPENENPIRTYTVLCADGSKMVLNGANIVNEQYFLKIMR